MERTILGLWLVMLLAVTWVLWQLAFSDMGTYNPALGIMVFDFIGAVALLLSLVALAVLLRRGYPRALGLAYLLPSLLLPWAWKTMFFLRR